MVDEIIDYIIEKVFSTNTKALRHGVKEQVYGTQPATFMDWGKIRPEQDPTTIREYQINEIERTLNELVTWR